jgi:hypothetical protein
MKRTRKKGVMSTGEITTHGNLLDHARGPFRRWAAGVAEWFRACTDYYAASALYEQLNRLSDAELRRRGLSRSTLARGIFECVERKCVLNILHLPFQTRVG